MTQWYPDAQVFDLRQEFDNLLLGDSHNPGIGQPVLLRRLLDAHCLCWNDRTGSPNPSCAACQGEGWKFVETLNVIFMSKNFGHVINPASVIMRQQLIASYGITDENRALAFARYDCFPNYERYLKPEHPSYDKLYELKIDMNGKLVMPVVRTAKWKISSVTPQRGDYGRIEYFDLGLEKIVA